MTPTAGYDPERDLAVVRFWERTPGTATMPTTIMLEEHRRGRSVPIVLYLFCGELGARLSVYGDATRSLTGDRLEVEWATDGGSPQRETWNVIVDEPRSISPPRARTVIASWREATELEFRLIGADPTTHRFNLGDLFAVPVIDSFDACMAAPIQPQSPPVTGVPTTEREELRFAADFSRGSEWLTSYVQLRDSGAAPAQEDAEDLRSRSSLWIACGMDGLDIAFTRLDAAQFTTIQGDAVDVTWTIDGRSQTERWVAYTLIFEYAVSPTDDDAFYEALHGARTLTIEVASDPPIRKTYELAKHGFWNTPVQPNLDACGG